MASISPTTLSCPSEPHSGKKSYLKLTITSISQTDGGTNQTTVGWKITAHNSWSTLYRAYCSLGGKVLYDGKPEKSSWSDGWELASGTTTFNNNSDGSLVLSAYLKQLFYYGNGVASRWENTNFYQDASANMTCSTIPRYFSSTPTLTLKSKTETSIVYNWSTSETCDNISVSGSGTKSITGVPGTSGTITITGLSANTSYSHTGTFRRKDSQLTTNSSATTNSTYNYPYITSAPNFTIGNTLTIGFYNPLGRSCAIYVLNTAGESYGGNTSTGTSISGYTSTAWQNHFYAGIPNAQNGKYKVRLVCSALGRDTTVDGGTYYIKGTEVPTFAATNITNVVDTLHVDDITGLNTKIIKGHNKITGTITPMSGNNSAGGKRYVVSANASPSSQELTHDGSNKTFTFENLTTNSFTVTAYDTRELSTARSKTVDLVDYSIPKVNNFTITRQNGLGNYAILTADGTNTYWSGWSQIKKYNTIQKVYFRYKATGGSYSSWVDITSTLTKNTNGAWTVNATLDIVFDTTSKYDFQLYVQDLLESSSVASNSLSTANGFLWRDLKNKRLGINKKPDEALDVSGNIKTDGDYILASGNVIPDYTIVDTW